MSKTNAINKGRDYYRAQQYLASHRRNERKYPAPVDVAVAPIPGKRKPEFVALGGRYYRRDNIKNKIYTVPHAFNAEGKPVTIPYQTCTLVRVEVSNEVSDVVFTDDLDRLPRDNPEESLPTG